jgi:hypothetical protein
MGVRVKALVEAFFFFFFVLLGGIASNNFLAACQSKADAPFLPI